MVRPEQRQQRGKAGETIEPALPLDMPRAAKSEARPLPAPRRRARNDAAETEADLFGAVVAPAVGKPEPVALQAGDVPVAARKTPGRRRQPVVELEAAGAVLDTIPDTIPAPDAAPPEQSPELIDEPPAASAAVLLPDEVLLQTVDPRSFHANERSDAWLYWLTDRGRAEEALRDGLPLAAEAALVLADRRAMLPRLAALAEDPDFSPASIAVLRLRRIAVDAFLRPGPEPDCYVLTGKAASEVNVSA